MWLLFIFLYVGAGALTNGNFSAGLSGWTVDAPNIVVAVINGDTLRMGNVLVDTDAVLNNTAFVSQPFTVPATCDENYTLHMDVFGATRDYTQENDYVCAHIVTADQTIIVVLFETLFGFNSPEPPTYFMPFSYSLCPALNAYVNQIVTLRFALHENGNGLATSLSMKNVRIE